MKKIAIVLGTRPEIIKMSPLIQFCENKKLDYFVVHTNQHYSEKLDAIFFEELKLPFARYNLNVGSGAIAFLEESTHGKQTALMLERIEKVFIKEKPDVVIVQGDTNTVLAGALAAAKLEIPVAHVEAGLRSYDRSMPEETNRIITDHISDYLFTPTASAENILLGEGIDPEKIFTVGNTVTDAVYKNARLAEKKKGGLPKLKVKGKYFLATCHRPGNVDTKKNLKNILDSLGLIHKKFKIPIIWPLHPRTENSIKKFKLKIPAGVQATEAVGYLDFLSLEANADLILTDSGGLQEEACILGVPCVTLRENTERPETIEVGANILAGNDPHNVLKMTEKMLKSPCDWQNPFGDGKTSEKIISIILK